MSTFSARGQTKQTAGFPIQFQYSKQWHLHGILPVKFSTFLSILLVITLLKTAPNCRAGKLKCARSVTDPHGENMGIR